VSQIRRKAAEPPNQPGAAAGPAAEPAEATGGSVWKPGDEPTWEDIEQAEAELIGDVGTDEAVAAGQGAEVPGKGAAEPEPNALDTARSGGGQPLPDALRTSLEATAGRDLSGVRIHDDPAAGQAAQASARRHSP
jgi:hypothetical protein